jgi:hypothetical protein
MLKTSHFFEESVIIDGGYLKAEMRKRKKNFYKIGFSRLANSEKFFF